ncbi:MAG: A/G-specific adenine glycosylase [Gemmataceae bacterium]
MPHVVNETARPSLTSLRRRLLAWFDRHRRDLPWRHNRDPYRIWVSEVMLQQTTVAAVVPYFDRFMAAFPTLADLAAADEQAVLKHWAGLGYYRRAKHLHQAARLLVAAGGSLPDDPEVWRALPGVGRYILGAVLSQAFDRRMPIIEANSLRVICRLFGQTGDPKSAAVQKWLWQTAEALLPKSRAGDFNQALMELGALVCTPAQPRCSQCPLRCDCVANNAGTQDKIPTKSAPAATSEVREVAVVIRRGEKVLLAQRPDDAVRWAGMWEFPRTELKDDEAHERAARRILRSCALKATLGSELTTLRYGVTRFQMVLTCFEANYSGGKFASAFYQRATWCRPGELTDYPLATAVRRLAELLLQESRQRRLF